jgi:hypothetical protein
MGSVMMSFSPSNLARTPSASQLSGRRRSFLNLAHRPPRVGRSPVARSTPWLSTCTLTWSFRNPGSVISTTSCSSPASFHSTTGSKSSNTRAAALLRRRSMATNQIKLLALLSQRASVHGQRLPRRVFMVSGHHDDAAAVLPPWKGCLVRCAGSRAGGRRP